MKKLLFILPIFCLFFLYSCKKDEPIVQIDYCKNMNDTTGKMIYQYKIFPKEVWIPMDYTEKLANRQLPIDYMNSLTNEQLFYNCLFWELNGDIMLFNTHQSGYIHVYNSFNGLQELFKRKNVELFLLNKLLEIYPQNIEVDCWLKILVTEMICAQQNIINQYNDNNTFIILEKWIYLYDEIINLKDWGYYDLSPAIRALSYILIKENYSEFLLFSKNEKFQDYLNGDIEIDNEIISNVIGCSKKYYKLKNSK